MPRTNTTHLTTFTRPNSVTYTFPITSPHRTHICLPPHSSWTSGLHWHETHTEYLQILAGSALITLSGATRTYTRADGIIIVPKFALHEWRRADVALGDASDGVDLEVVEWTDPSDGAKEVFFRNLNSLILDHSSQDAASGLAALLPGPLADTLLMLKLFMVFRALDNFPVFWMGPGFIVGPNGVLGGASGGIEPGWVGRVVALVVAHFVFAVVGVLGGWAGWKGWYNEYTPDALREVVGGRKDL